MALIDVTVTITSGMVTWPGDPAVVVERVQKMEEGAHNNISHLSLSAHTGTHLDAPYHFIQDGKGIDQLDPRLLIGPVLVKQVDDSVKRIDSKVLEALALPKGTKRLLLKTSNSKIWDSTDQEFHYDYVAINEDGANYLVSQGIKLIGIDYLSISPYKDSVAPHRALLSHKVVIVEGLNLAKVPPGNYQLYCLPLKIKDADGAPARVFLGTQEIKKTKLYTE